jgi:DNA-binding NtrC family response regulator
MVALRAPGRIVVVDDDPRVVDLLVAGLREDGYGVMGALTSEAGLKLTVLSRADLVLLDIELARVNGMDLLKRIRAFDPAIRIIVVTGNRDPVRAREALELGALAYVDKPFDLAYLKRVVAMALQQSA